MSDFKPCGWVCQAYTQSQQSRIAELEAELFDHQQLVKLLDQERDKLRAALEQERNDLLWYRKKAQQLMSHHVAGYADENALEMAQEIEKEKRDAHVALEKYENAMDALDDSPTKASE